MSAEGIISKFVVKYIRLYMLVLKKGVSITVYTQYTLYIQVDYRLQSVAPQFAWSVYDFQLYISLMAGEGKRHDKVMKDASPHYVGLL